MRRRPLLAALVAALVFSFASPPSTAAAPDSRAVAAKKAEKKRKRVVAAVRRYLGVRYVFAGASFSGIDCSGLTLVAYRAVGIRLPHLAAAQERYGRRVTGRLRLGDLVFFNRGGHVGVYVGGGMMIAASSAYGRVKYQRLADYGLSFDGARRLIP